jgi:hypothetical protein
MNTPKFKLAPLSKIQIRLLCTLAGQAFNAARLRGAVDDDQDAESYRREGQLEACGVASLKECNQSHFLAIRGKWFVVLGRLEDAFNDVLNAGEQAEATRQMKWRFVGQVAALAESIGDKHERETGIVLDPPARAARALAYAEGISRSQFHSGLKGLTARQVEILGFTITNRANALAGRGDSQNRNKSQRLRSTAKGGSEPPGEGSLIERAARRLGQALPPRCPESGSDRL